ncbi:MAG TPA: peptidoglycan editing factor PgeF [Bryobacteraceae bacterium]|nr:peptidoglycan editing factor PgeF [Bryobacteraceae bacterium]
MDGFLTVGVFASMPVEHGFGLKSSVLPPDLAGLRQIHSDRILVAQETGNCGDGDALITGRPELAVSIRTADCYPILLADARTGAVAAVHSGWRGTAARIVLRTLERMNHEFGTEPGDIRAAIGPGIGACCYEVGRDVALQFGIDGGRAHLDLAQENRRQMERAGIRPQNIEALGICTFCDAERFFSYRREKEKAGRMTSFIRIVRPR